MLVSAPINASGGMPLGGAVITDPFVLSSAAYPDGSFEVDPSGNVLIGDANGDVNGTCIVINEVGSIIEITANTRIDIGTPLINLDNGNNLVSIAWESTSAGLKIGTGTNQKLGFYNATPIIQPSGNIVTGLSNLGLVSTGTLAITDVTGLEDSLAGKVSINGDTMNGNLDLNGFSLNNIGEADANSFNTPNSYVGETIASYNNIGNNYTELTPDLAHGFNSSSVNTWNISNDTGQMQASEYQTLNGARLYDDGDRGFNIADGWGSNAININTDNYGVNLNGWSIFDSVVGDWVYNGGILYGQYGVVSYADITASGGVSANNAMFTSYINVDVSGTIGILTATTAGNAGLQALLNSGNSILQVTGNYSNPDNGILSANEIDVGYGGTIGQTGTANVAINGDGIFMNGIPIDSATITGGLNLGGYWQISDDGSASFGNSTFQIASNGHITTDVNFDGCINATAVYGVQFDSAVITGDGDNGLNFRDGIGATLNWNTDISGLSLNGNLIAMSGGNIDMGGGTLYGGSLDSMYQVITTNLIVDNITSSGYPININTTIWNSGNWRIDTDGVATFDSVNVNTGIVLADGAQIAFGTSGGTKLGGAVGQKVAFHGANPVGQRAGSAQAAVATTAPTNITPYGYTSAQATAIVTLLNEIRAALVEKGIIKGSA